jgi:hypothetical protein
MNQQSPIRQISGKNKFHAKQFVLSTKLVSTKLLSEISWYKFAWKTNQRYAVQSLWFSGLRRCCLCWSSTCNAVWTCRQSPTFRTNVPLPPLEFQPGRMGQYVPHRNCGIYPPTAHAFTSSTKTRRLFCNLYHTVQCSGDENWFTVYRELS